MRAAWWWIDRWRFSSAYRDMSLAEQGAYRNLLDECWIRQGPLPDDDLQLGAISGKPGEWPAVRAAVLAHFVLDKTGWHNITVENVIRESRRKAKNQRAYLARRTIEAGHVTDQMAGQNARSLSPAEKNHPESKNGAGSEGVKGQKPKPGPQHHPESCLDPMCCDRGAANFRARLPSQ